MGERGLHEVDGWFDDDPKVLRFFLSNGVPRPFGVADQLKHDLGTWGSGPMWIASLLCIPAAIYFGKWWIAAIGVSVAAFFAPATVGLARTFRYGRLFTFTVDRLENAPFPSDTAACSVECSFPEGARTARVLVQRSAAERLMQSSGVLEILVAADPKALQYALCVGMRPGLRRSS